MDSNLQSEAANNLKEKPRREAGGDGKGGEDLEGENVTAAWINKSIS